MNQQLRRPWHRRATVLAAGVTLCVAGGSAVVVGFAAGLGGVRSTALDAWSEALTADVPSIATCDNFDGPDGPLAGRIVQTTERCGTLTWPIDLDNWSVTAGHAVSNGTEHAVATLPVALTDASVAATLFGADSGSEVAGVVVNHDGASTYLAAIVVGDPQVRVDLMLMAGGAPTVLASADIVIGSTCTVVLARDGSSVEVHVDGESVIDFTLGAGISAVLGAGDRAGLYASSSSVQFDNLRVTTPSPW